MGSREVMELQFLGFCGILRESYRIIFSSKKVFSQITLALIFPLTFILLAQIQISDLIFGKILRDESWIQLVNNSNSTSNSSSIKDRLSSEWAYFYLFKAAYLIFFVILSLLSTSAVVYAVACIYTAKPMTFKKVISIVPKVWKRLIVTFFWNFIVLLVYHIAAIIILVLWFISIRNTIAGAVVVIILAILYLTGLVYICVVWELASVVSVLEETYGLKAMKKSKILIKGKLLAASFILILMDSLFTIIQSVFEGFVVHGGDSSLSINMIYRVILGIVCFILLVKVFLISLVVQTVIYFVCKSYHHENIDKSSLSEHLESYQGNCFRLRGEGVGEVQLEQHSNV